MSATESAAGEAAIGVRPLETDDLEVLRSLDEAYAERTGMATVVDPATLRHFARAGHAFVAYVDDASAPRGTVLAHTVWDGSRPVVRGARLVADDDDPVVLARLLGALVKSAYDAGVYDVVVEVPEADGAGQAALRAAGFDARPVRRFERVLGSRAAGAA